MTEFIFKVVHKVTGKIGLQTEPTTEPILPAYLWYLQEYGAQQLNTTPDSVVIELIRVSTDV